MCMRVFRSEVSFSAYVTTCILASVFNIAHFEYYVDGFSISLFTKYCVRCPAGARASLKSISISAVSQSERAPIAMTVVACRDSCWVCDLYKAYLRFSFHVPR